ncbi:MAG: GNAT family N-acetyltransferase [Mycobacterium sp.]|uniref:GNAT family N-acetyltransferase n=1 Tax=Mycobacterium sp. TaxID=1785 RepID=UPI003899CD0E
MLLLRPRWKTVDAVIHFIDTKLRPTGYRLVGAFEHSSGTATSIIGFRELWSTAHGHYMYIDDVSTLETARGNGLADELIRWVIADAKRRRRSPSGFRRWERSGSRTSAVHAEPHADLSPSLLARSRHLTNPHIAPVMHESTTVTGFDGLAAARTSISGSWCGRFDVDPFAQLRLHCVEPR